MAYYDDLVSEVRPKSEFPVNRETRRSVAHVAALLRALQRLLTAVNAKLGLPEPPLVTKALADIQELDHYVQSRRGSALAITLGCVGGFVVLTGVACGLSQKQSFFLVSYFVRFTYVLAFYVSLNSSVTNGRRIQELDRYTRRSKTGLVIILTGPPCPAAGTTLTFSSPFTFRSYGLLTSFCVLHITSAYEAFHHHVLNNR